MCVSVRKWGVKGKRRGVGLWEESEIDGRKAKGQRRREKGGTEGYLKDISQNVGEEKTERRAGRRNSVMELCKEKYGHCTNLVADFL